MINLTPVSNVVGVLLLIIGALMFTGIPFSWYFDSGDGLESVFFGGHYNFGGFVVLVVSDEGRYDGEETGRLLDCSFGLVGDGDFWEFAVYHKRSGG